MDALAAGTICVVIIFGFVLPLAWLASRTQQKSLEAFRRQADEIVKAVEQNQRFEVFKSLTPADYEFLSRGMPDDWLPAQVGEKNAETLRLLWDHRGRHKGTQQAG